MTLTDMALEMLKMDTENKIFSEIKGRRNYAIRIEEIDGNKNCYVGTYGQMKRRGMMGEFIYLIAKFNVRWFIFTYKRDLLKALNVLKHCNYNIIWLQ